MFCRHFAVHGGRDMKTGGQASENCIYTSCQSMQALQGLLSSCSVNRGNFLIDWRLAVIDGYVLFKQTSSPTARW